ncbi:ABC transporter permease [Persicitalea jodogahamensis]|uniref:ABC transporter permease n=1 Tax=Persicitalea jodogahamensis TaxID=402147 RepID=A0A8J3D175_9BACT|nr:ABC transporter permease [Persicitalea jodogahamensis]GHB54917.1 ABC transporter permease [Persicitalea jodogahamensis]
MLRNNLKIALRNLSRHRGFTILNTLGLSVGVAAALLLFMVVRYENSFDKFHANYDRIYRVIRQQAYADGSGEVTPGAPLPVAAALKTDIPQFERVVPIYGTLDPQVTVLGRNPDSGDLSAKFIEDNEGLMVDPGFFKMFDFQWLEGGPDVLAEPNVVVLSRKFAEKYFKDYQQAVGQYLRINNTTTMKVGGILEDAPQNTDFPLNIVLSYESKRTQPKLFGFGDFENWGSTSSSDQIFVQLPENFEVASANALLEKFSRKHYDKRNDKDKKTHSLSPFAALHHDTELDNYKDRAVPRERIRNIAIVGVLILLMACINFINIYSALATKRAKEVGVRKVLGSQKGQLVAQFLTETFLVVLASVLAGFMLAYMALPILENMFDVPTDPALDIVPRLGLWLAGLSLGLTFLAGLYPALVLSSFSPLEVFQKKASRGWAGGLTLRQSLIVFQFAAALVLIIGTVINLRQMEYISQLDLGFVKEGVYNLNLDTEYSARNATLRNELLQIPEVSAVSFSSDPPSSSNNWGSNFAYTNLSEDEDFEISMKMADGDYFKTYGIEFLAGGPYANADTSTKFVVNERLLQKLGIKDPASVIGHKLRMGGWEPAPIVGVIKDFHTKSAREDIDPILITQLSKFYWSGAVKLESKNLPQTVAKVKVAYEKIFPEVPFVGKFYEENIENFYQAEQQMGLLYRVFAGLTVFIACLGLFGLSAFAAEQRTKEIGVRKVLGASVLGLTALLSKDFLKLVGIAIVIASPIAWYLMKSWMAGFQYQIGIEWWVFVVAALLAVAVALGSVSYQAIRAALMNPVKSLRSE